MSVIPRLSETQLDGLYGVVHSMMHTPRVAGTVPQAGQDFFRTVLVRKIEASEFRDDLELPLTAAVILGYAMVVFVLGGKDYPQNIQYRVFMDGDIRRFD
jgi:hypothetical protein